MAILILGLVLFLGTHAFTMLRGPRSDAIGRLGENRYKIGYTVLSILGFVLMIVGLGQYRAHGMIPGWDPPVWTRHLALLLTLFAFISLAAMGPRPSHIQAAVKHPMLLAVKIWATAHLLANGDLGSILLFGGFLAWAVAARISLKRRTDEPARKLPKLAPAGWRLAIPAVAAGAGEADATGLERGVGAAPAGWGRRWRRAGGRRRPSAEAAGGHAAIRAGCGWHGDEGSGGCEEAGHEGGRPAPAGSGRD